MLHGVKFEVMEQSGIKTVTLYENDNISFSYPDLSNSVLINSISSDGLILSIENCQDNSFKNNFSRGASFEKILNSELQFTLLGFTKDNAGLIKQLNTSLFGFSILVEYLNGRSFFYEAAFKPEKVETDKESNSFRLKLINNVGFLNRPKELV